MDTTLRALTAFPQQLAELFDCVPPSHRHWRPESWEGMPSETLTALEQVCHVRDIEIEGYQQRFQRLLTQSDPLLASIDTYALASFGAARRWRCCAA